MVKETVFRFDDYCGNTDSYDIRELMSVILKKVPKAKFLIGVCPLYVDRDDERAFPPEWAPRSNPYDYYNVDSAFWNSDEIDVLTNGFDDGDAEFPVIIASHGLVHCDHTRLTEDELRMSIVLSCKLLKTNVFIPPYNKWDARIVRVCRENKINLIKYEDGWKHVKYNEYDKKHCFWYVHPYEVNAQFFEWWFG